ncbi:hypothetical protein ABTD05_19740, partial [Acinetobacter baumannii]
LRLAPRLPRGVAGVMRFVETSPGVYEQARHRYIHSGDPKPGDVVLHAELRPDGTWSEPKPVTVTA